MVLGEETSPVEDRFAASVPRKTLYVGFCISGALHDAVTVFFSGCIRSSLCAGLGNEICLFNGGVSSSKPLR